MIVNIGAAVNLIAAVRTHTAQHTGCPEWDPAGIRAMLTGSEGSPGSVLAAAALAAEDTNLRAPSVAALRHHWPVNATSTPPRASLDVACIDHPQHDMPCPHRDHAGDMTLEQIAEAKRVALAAAAANPYIPPAIKRARALEETP